LPIFAAKFATVYVATVAVRAGANLLSSKNLQDGLVIDRLTIPNPFAAANESALDDWLGSAR
jgi:predicted nucleic acid-binding protein